MRESRRWAATVAVGLTMTIGLSGCYVQRTELSAEKAREQIKQGREYEADEWEESKTALEAAAAAIKQSQSLVEQKQGKQALASSQESVKRSKEALDASRARYSESVLKKAS